MDDEIKEIIDKHIFYVENDMIHITKDELDSLIYEILNLGITLEQLSNWN